MFTCFVFLSPWYIYGATYTVYPDVPCNPRIFFWRGGFFPHKQVFCISVLKLSFSLEVK